jgi:hypothetical protein
MKVETYEIAEVKEETEQQNAEAVQLCEQLGLTGQLKKSTAETAVRFPYRLMHDDELFIYGILCPEQSDVHSFSNEPIPLEVLKTIAYVKSLGVFKVLMVWSASSKAVKDPVLVGYIESQWHGSPYLIARWGEELLPLEVLLPDALKKWWTQRRSALRQIEQQVKAELANDVCPDVIPTGSIRTMPAFYA